MTATALEGNKRSRNGLLRDALFALVECEMDRQDAGGDVDGSRDVQIAAFIMRQLEAAAIEASEGDEQ